MNTLKEIKNKIDTNKEIFKLTLLDVIYTLEDMEEVKKLSEKDILKIIDFFSSKKFSIYDWQHHIYFTILSIISHLEGKEDEV